VKRKERKETSEAAFGKTASIRHKEGWETIKRQRKIEKKKANKSGDE